ncbi:hypothetical protein Agub_g14681 [Astrephomene gubernaculifera]|uniref:Uncharacterized protein n=1 Tax=Astrephomene gubernaculifera TaxID=47775 RepID=A0AAD3E2I3_9CHLO|nr:hypothetical protein Agub_g14681 [Astrephomene gubernaculifera]
MPQPPLQQQQHSLHRNSGGMGGAYGGGAGAGAGLSILRSATSSFVRAGSGVVPLGCGAGGRLVSDTGLTSAVQSPSRLPAGRCGAGGVGAGGSYTVSGGVQGGLRSGSFLYGAGRPNLGMTSPLLRASAAAATRRAAAGHGDGGGGGALGGVASLRRLIARHGGSGDSFSALCSSSMSGGGGVNNSGAAAPGGAAVPYGSYNTPFDPAAPGALRTTGSMSTLGVLPPQLAAVPTAGGGGGVGYGGSHVFGSGRSSSVNVPLTGTAMSGDVAVSIGASMFGAPTRSHYPSAEAVAEASSAAAVGLEVAVHEAGADAAAANKLTSSGVCSAPLVTASLMGMGLSGLHQQQQYSPHRQLLQQAAGMQQEGLYVIGQTAKPSAPRQASVARLLAEDNDTPTGGDTEDETLPSDDAEDGLSPFVAMNAMSRAGPAPATRLAAATAAGSTAVRQHGDGGAHAVHGLMGPPPLPLPPPAGPPVAAARSTATTSGSGNGAAGAATSSYLLGSGMPPEIIDAGIAILRGASDSTQDSSTKRGVPAAADAAPTTGNVNGAAEVVAAGGGISQQASAQPFALVLPPPSPAPPPPPPAAVSPPSGGVLPQPLLGQPTLANTTTTNAVPRQSFSFIPFHRSVAEEPSSPMAVAAAAAPAGAVLGTRLGPRSAAAAPIPGSCGGDGDGVCCNSCSARLAAPAPAFGATEEEDALLRDLLSLQIPRTVHSGGDSGPFLAAAPAGPECNASSKAASGPRKGCDEMDVSFNVEDVIKATVPCVGVDGADAAAAAATANDAASCLLTADAGARIAMPAGNLLSSGKDVALHCCAPAGPTAHGLEASGRVVSFKAASGAAAAAAAAATAGSSVLDAVAALNQLTLRSEDGEQGDRSRRTSTAATAGSTTTVVPARPHTVGSPLRIAPTTSSSLAAFSSSCTQRSGGLASAPSSRHMSASAAAAAAAVSPVVAAGGRRAAGKSPGLSTSRSQQPEGKAWPMAAATRLAGATPLPPPPPSPPALQLPPPHPSNSQPQAAPLPQQPQERAPNLLANSTAAASYNNCPQHHRGHANAAHISQPHSMQSWPDAATAAAAAAAANPTAVPGLSSAGVRLMDHAINSVAAASARRASSGVADLDEAAAADGSAAVPPPYPSEAPPLTATAAAAAPLFAIDAATAAGGNRSLTATAPGIMRALAAAVAAAGSAGGGGVDASNAVSVVLVVGHDGGLRVPLRCLELPLRGAMARRPGTTVSFRVSGLSHDGMRQLRALMSVAKVPMPERTYAWLLPSSSARLPSTTTTANGYVLPNVMHGGAGGGGAGSLARSSLSLGPSQSLGYGQGLGLLGGPGLLFSQSMSRMDSGPVYGNVYAHMPSYCFENRGQPIDLGYILPADSMTERSGCFSVASVAAAAAAAAGGGASQQGYSSASNVLETAKSMQQQMRLSYLLQQKSISQSQRDRVAAANATAAAAAGLVTSSGASERLRGAVDMAPAGPLATPAPAVLPAAAAAAAEQLQQHASLELKPAAAKPTTGTAADAVPVAAAAAAASGLPPGGCSEAAEGPSRALPTSPSAPALPDDDSSACGGVHFVLQTGDLPSCQHPTTPAAQATSAAPSADVSVQSRRSPGTSPPNLPHGIMLVNLPFGRRAVVGQVPARADSAPVPPQSLPAGSDLYGGGFGAEDFEQQPYTGTLEYGSNQDRSGYSRVSAGSAAGVSAVGGGGGSSLSSSPPNGGSGGASRRSGGSGGAMNTGVNGGNGFGGLASGCGGLAVSLAPFGCISMGPSGRNRAAASDPQVTAPEDASETSAAVSGMPAATYTAGNGAAMGAGVGTAMLGSVFSTHAMMMVDDDSISPLSERPISRGNPQLLMMGRASSNGAGVLGAAGGAFGSTMEVCSSVGASLATLRSFGTSTAAAAAAARGGGGGGVTSGGSRAVPTGAVLPARGTYSIAGTSPPEACAEGTLPPPSPPTATTQHAVPPLLASAAAPWLTDTPAAAAAVQPPSRQASAASVSREGSRKLVGGEKAAAAAGGGGGGKAKAASPVSSSPSSPSSPSTESKRLGSPRAAATAAAGGGEGRGFSRFGGSSSRGKGSMGAAVPAAASMGSR